MGKRYSPEKLKELLAVLQSEDERSLIKEADDPVLWADNHLWHPDDGIERFKTKKMFYNILRDPAKDRAGRVGRQAGKTVHLVVDIMHTAAHETRAVILVFIPEKKQMNRMLEIMQNLLKQSDTKSSFRMGKHKTQKSGVEPEYDYEIYVSSGSVIRFFFMSHNPDKARGQRGTHIYIDEVDYLPEKAFPVVVGILKSNPQIKIWATSTPSGIEDTWFMNYCKACASPLNEDGSEYHLPSTLEENWPEIEARLREVIFDEVTWRLEVLAEWAEAKGAVYKREAIDSAIERSMFNGIYLTAKEIMETLEYKTAIKCLGVDWNDPQNGVRLVEIAKLYGNPWVVRNERIAYETYTQTGAVARIMELYKQHNYGIISVDSGYGSTQIELLHKELVALGREPSRILNIVDSNKSEEMSIEYTSPLTGGRRKEVVMVKTKHKLVGVLAKHIEGDLVLLKEEDENKEGIVKEIRNFRRKAANQYAGGFQYTENTHSLSALQISLHGYLKFAGSGGRARTDAAQTMRAESINEIIRSRNAKHAPSAFLHTQFAGRQQINSRTAGLTRIGKKDGGTRRYLI